MERSARLYLLAAIALLFSLSGKAQDVVGGVLTTWNNFGQVGGYTIVNLDTPFNTDGQITSFTARFAPVGGATLCSAGDNFKIRVFRPNTGNAYQLVAERGTWGEAPQLMTVTLTPPIAVKRGDLLGIALFGPGGCALTGTYGTRYHLVQMNGDYTAGSPSYAVDAPGSAMNFRASSASSALVGTLPGAGVTGGAGGASFNTSLSITNPNKEFVTLTVAYRAIGAAPGATPVTATVTVPPLGTKSPKLTDLMSINGVGSIDIYSTGGTPVVAARIYNDTGSGTNGFTEPMVEPTAVAHELDRLWLPIPADLSAYRMNIGVRTFANGATFVCDATTPDGAGGVGGFTKTYAANATSLEPLQSFFNNNPGSLIPGGSVVCSAVTPSTKADYILYATVTDNRTNDSAMYLAEKH
ncbi:MAG TPA: hypothetical protein VHU41_07310 [Thermoanaerobaculia bacterium]|jgi:hypothetical protein|nr:hypothetical protein [Thermoanaerobaculia bacterium]